MLKQLYFFSYTSNRMQQLAVLTRAGSDNLGPFSLCHGKMTSPTCIRPSLVSSGTGQQQSSGPRLTPFIWKWVSPLSLWLELADGPARPDLAETQASEKTSWFSICTSATEVFRASCDCPQMACLQPLPLSDTRIEQL